MGQMWTRAVCTGVPYYIFYVQLLPTRGILGHVQPANGAYTKTRAVCHDQNSSLLLQGRYCEASPLGDKVVIKIHIFHF